MFNNQEILNCLEKYNHNRIISSLELQKFGKYTWLPKLVI